eukprot:TRINITY_DN3973_c0_g1_i1.p1 TRINITY_DN3973_c0_g1~~TRINITY_DN3973_c0_g1_i1.p1  ORF type:complete len:136 (-),score=14.61 TRINITY_DN3973_c0_g1_i1:69-476(-)
MVITWDEDGRVAPSRMGIRILGNWKRLLVVGFATFLLTLTCLRVLPAHSQPAHARGSEPLDDGTCLELWLTPLGSRPLRIRFRPDLSGNQSMHWVRRLATVSGNQGGVFKLYRAETDLLIPVSYTHLTLPTKRIV